MANDRSVVLECRVAWIQKNRVGLTFLETADAVDGPPAS
jgi:hypothetical protein